MVARVAGKGSLEFRADEHPNRFAALEQRVRAEAASVIVANCRQRSSNRMPAGFRILPMVPSGKQCRSGLSVSIGPIRMWPLHQSRPLQSEIGHRNLSMAYLGLQWAIVAAFVMPAWTEGIVGNCPRGATLYQFVSQGAACAERCDLPLVHHLFQYAAGRGLADLEQRLRLFSGD